MPHPNILTSLGNLSAETNIFIAAICTLSMQKRVRSRIRPKVMARSARKFIREMARDSIPGTQINAPAWTGRIDKINLRRKQRELSSWHAHSILHSARNRSDIASPDVRRRLDAITADFSPAGRQRLERFNARKETQAQAFYEHFLSLKQRKRAFKQSSSAKKMRPSRPK